MGKFKGLSLATVPAVQTTWSEWHRAHPETKLLKKSREVRSSAYEAYFKDATRYGLFRTEWLTDRMPGKALVHGITDGPHARGVHGQGNRFHLGPRSRHLCRGQTKGRAPGAPAGYGRLLVRVEYVLSEHPDHSLTSRLMNNAPRSGERASGSYGVGSASTD